MAALTANANVLSRGSGDLRQYLVADNVHIFKGGLVALDTSGYARPARNTAGELVAGIADAEFDNTITGHAAGGRDARGQKGVPVVSGRHFQLVTAAAAQAWVGSQTFALDDQTVRQTVGNGNGTGIVTEFVSATSVWVFVATPMLAPTSIFQQLTVNNGITITAGALTLGAAASRIVPGATSLALRNNANSADNLLVNDAGDMLARNFIHSSVGLFMGNGSENVPADSSNAPAAAAWLGGAIRQVPTAARTLTTDTGTNIDTAIIGVRTGDFFYTVIFNNSAGANAITLAAGAGVTFYPAVPGTIAQNKTAILLFLRTGAAAWNCYSLIGA